MYDKKIAPIEISIWDIPSVSYGGKVYRIINSDAVKLGDNYIITDVDGEGKENYLDIIEDIMCDELRITSVSNISHVKGLDSMNFLKTLSLTDGSITRVSLIEKLTNLEMLDLNHNKISDISGLEGLSNLINLDLSHNEIEDVGNLSGLLSLKELYLDNNNVHEIDGKMLPNGLEVLSIKGNPDPNLKNFDRLWRLRELIK
jgi:hypothetical protein